MFSKKLIMHISTFLIFLVLFIRAAFSQKSYEGYKVYKLTPKSISEINLIKQLKFVEFWEEHFEVNYGSKLMVAPDNQKEFLEVTNANNISVQEVINNLGSVINEQLQPSRLHASITNKFLSFDWDNYHNLDEIYKWLDELQENYPDVIKTVVIGKSVENRDIKGVVLNYQPEKEDKLIGVIEGGIHAREWISPATVTWILKEFLTSTDLKVRALAENLEWHIFPTVNPDGYSYTFTHNRIWRKNRSKASFTSCSSSDDDMSNGVDLNRNFDIVWNSYGTSNDSCSNTYAGPSPGSEPETKAIVEHILKLKNEGELIYYLAFHSYSQLLIIPYSHLSGSDVLQAKNYGDMYEIAIRSATKLSERYGTTYTVGVSADVMYEMSGTSFDWVKYETDIPVAYLFELRDLGDHGFLLPPEQIVPNNLEIMDALLELDRTTRALGYYYLYNSGYRVFSLLCLVVLMSVLALLS